MVSKLCEPLKIINNFCFWPVGKVKPICIFLVQLKILIILLYIVCIKIERTNNSLTLNDKHGSRVEINNFLKCWRFIQGTYTAVDRGTLLCELNTQFGFLLSAIPQNMFSFFLLYLRRDSYNHFTSFASGYFQIFLSLSFVHVSILGWCHFPYNPVCSPWYHAMP